MVVRSEPWRKRLGRVLHMRDAVTVAGYVSATVAATKQMVCYARPLPTPNAHHLRGVSTTDGGEDRGATVEERGESVRVRERERLRRRFYAWGPEKCITRYSQACSRLGRILVLNRTIHGLHSLNSNGEKLTTNLPRSCAAKNTSIAVPILALL